MPAAPEVIVAVVHAPSKLHQSEGDRGELMRRLARDIADVEERRGHQRTVVVGDFNQDPSIRA
jgi:hypothetical protein